MPYGVEHPSGVVFVSRARVQERPELYGRGGEEAVRRLDFGALPDRLPVFMDEELQVEIDANSRLVVAIGLPLPGSRNDFRAFTESGVDRSRSVCHGLSSLRRSTAQGRSALATARLNGLASERSSAQAEGPSVM